MNSFCTVPRKFVQAAPLSETMSDFPDELWKLCFASADKPNWYRFDIKSLQRSSYQEKLDKLVPVRAVCPQKTVRNLAVKRAWITVLLSLLQKGFLYKSAGSICLSSLCARHREAYSVEQCVYCCVVCLQHWAPTERVKQFLLRQHFAFVISYIQRNTIQKKLFLSLGEGNNSYYLICEWKAYATAKKAELIIM